MALKRCLECATLTPRTRCPTHERARSRARGTTSQRGYGADHARLRAHLVTTYHPSDPCPRCGLPLGLDPDALDLAHTEDRQGYLGLMHAPCNRDTARRR
jgi:hypothetical protein